MYLFSFFNFMAFLLVIAYVILLIVGLVLSKKYEFKPGFYFFLILMIGGLYSVVHYYFMMPILDTLDLEMMDYGNAMSIIPNTIELLAFIIIIVGLYRMLKTYTDRDGNDHTDQTGIRKEDNN